MARRARRRRLADRAVPGASSCIVLWFIAGDPGGLAAAGLIVLAGAALGILSRFLLLLLLGLPGGLVPRSCRRWWRRGEGSRPAIHAWLRRAVYAADGYRCCYCASPERLQLDHVFPWSLGGRSVLWNMVTLCGRCNVIKSNYWARREKIIAYTPFPGHANLYEASLILRKEKRRRLSPLRIIRAAIALT